jgi:hypothetical protein
LNLFLGSFLKCCDKGNGFTNKNRIETGKSFHSIEKRAINIKRMLNHLLGVKAGSRAFTKAITKTDFISGSFLKCCDKGNGFTNKNRIKTGKSFHSTEKRATNIRWTLGSCE